MADPNAFVDADGHVIERGHANFADYFEPPFSEIPDLGSKQLLPSLDRFHTPHQGMLRQEAGIFEPAGAERWLEFLDKTGLAWTVLYPTDALRYGRVVYPDWALAYAKAYNNWLYDNFLKVSPRLNGVALVPLQDVGEGVKELRRAVNELGMVGMMVPSNGLYNHISAEMFWPIYEEAERLNCAVAIHGGSYEDLGFNTFTKFGATRALGMPIPLMIAMTGLIVDGVLDMYPKLRVGFLEGGAGWIPLIIDRLRREAEYGGLELKRDPEEYFRRGQLYVGCEGNEGSLAYVIERIGPQSVVFASDFPHEITMDNCMEEINEVLERSDLREEDKTMILAKNARAFYNIWS